MKLTCADAVVMIDATTVYLLRGARDRSRSDSAEEDVGQPVMKKARSCVTDARQMLLLRLRNQGAQTAPPRTSAEAADVVADAPATRSHGHERDVDRPRHDQRRHAVAAGPIVATRNQLLAQLRGVAGQSSVLDIRPPRAASSIRDGDTRHAHSAAASGADPRRFPSTDPRATRPG